MKFLLAAALLLTAAAPAAAVNILVNGDFEAVPAAPGSYIQYAGGQTFPGWTATGNDILNIDSGYSEFGLFFTAQGGSGNALDLTGAGNTGAADGVTQTVNTIAGQTYRLTFYVGNASPTGGNAGSYGLPSTLNLSIDGGAISQFTNGDNTDFTVNFKQFTTTFVAGATTTLAFTNGTPGGDNYLGLDTVSLAAVPEPATWAMMLTGFGLVGFASRRRKLARVAA